MYVQPGEWSNLGEPRVSEARSIGSILSEMREVAALRARRPRNAGAWRNR
jgi:hypothetical protein